MTSELLFVAGFGRFQYWLVAACGLANASDAIEIICVSFLLPSAECDFKLSSVDKGWISATMFIGKTFMMEKRIWFMPLNRV